MLQSYFLAEMKKTAGKTGDGREDLCESKLLHLKLLMLIKGNVTPRRTIFSLVSLYTV